MQGTTGVIPIVMNIKKASTGCRGFFNIHEKTKDIRLLTWLTEAWAHLYGLEGIAKGLELSYRMLKQYWLNIAQYSS